MHAHQRTQQGGRGHHGHGRGAGPSAATTTAATIHCANCGGAGHVHKSCNHPITSYGVICYRVSPEDGQPEYLMVQRKDSLSYVEFMRGKYSISQRQYIMHLFSNMTERERQALLHTDFQRLWSDLWQVDGGRNFQKEYAESCAKHEQLKAGFLLRTAAEGEQQQQQLCHVDMASIMADTVSQLPEPEWGFPKGRRNINEVDLHCALREFREETGLHPRHLTLLQAHKPLEELFSGSNRVRYRHVYYLARAPWNAPLPDHRSFGTHGGAGQSREIQSVRWFRYEQAQGLIRDLNVERKELFRRVHGYVLREIAAASRS